MIVEQIDGSGAEPSGSAPDLVQLDDVSKNFGATRAVDNVTFSVSQGEIFGLVGENGAGKSTIAKMLAGVIAPDSGRILIAGQSVDFRSPNSALKAGVAMMAQEINLVPDRTVEENVLLGNIPRSGPFANQKALRQRYMQVMEQSGFNLSPTARVGGLRIADQQKVELMRALSWNAKLIIMDEPSAALTADEVTKLHESILGLRLNGTSVILVSHFLDEVLSLANRVAILRDGKLIRIGHAANESSDSLVESMVGSSLITEYSIPKTRASTEVRFKVESLSTPSLLKDVNFEIQSGEILGLAGLVGAGRSEIARAIFGVDQKSSGKVFLDGEELRINSPKQAIKQGVFMIPESRKDQGLVLSGSIRDNLVLSSLSQLSKAGITSNNKFGRVAENLASVVDLRFDSIKSPVSSLSGGNQQKILFGRAMEINPKVLIVDEPTRGVDIAAKRAIHGLLEQMAARGTSILFISSEIEEVLGVCHRTLVIHKGAVQASFTPPYNQAVIISAFFGQGGK